MHCRLCLVSPPWRSIGFATSGCSSHSLLVELALENRKPPSFEGGYLGVSLDPCRGNDYLKKPTCCFWYHGVIRALALNSAEGHPRTAEPCTDSARPAVPRCSMASCVRDIVDLSQNLRTTCAR